MGLVNRDKDASEQKDVVFYASAACAGSSTLVTGVTRVIAMVPYPCVLANIGVAALGCSGAMAVSFAKNTFAGGGLTSYAVSISNLILQNFGTSGQVGYSGLAAAGSTLLQFQAGDQLVMSTSVANTACTDLLLNIALKKVQDIVSINGVST
jgi:hypothetical protein